MDAVFDGERSGWRSVLATFLWVIVAVGGLSLLAALQPILYAIGVTTMSNDVTAMVMDKYRLVFVRNVGSVLFGMAWLGGIIALNSYYTRSRSMRQLLTRFAYGMLVVGGVWGLGYLVERLAIS